ncbi:MAG: T9SS type A sorting domain-containing protein [Flavobacteriales bacterium]|nr:T9SS type A sorting domain-containing protein [Flavobacteriales bacterium]
MLNKTFFLLLTLVTSFSWSQDPFIKVYGNNGFDYCRDIEQNLSSNYYLTGSSSSFIGGSADAYLLKIDADGNFLWSYNYGGNGIEWGEELEITHDSSLAIAGYTTSIGAGGFDFYLVKVDSTDGSPQWERSYGGADWDKAYDFVQLPDSGFVLVGETYSFGDMGRNGYMVRTDKNGDTLWTRLFDGPGESFLKGVFLDETLDSIVVCGGSESGGAGMLDGYIAKLDLDGNLGGEHFLGTPYDDYFNDINANFGYYLVGGGLGTEEEDNQDLWVLKLHQETMEVIFEENNSAVSTDTDFLNSVWVRPVGDDKTFFCGQTRTYDWSWLDGSYSFYFGKRDWDGLYIIRKTYGMQGFDAAHAIRSTNDNGTIIVGDVHNYATGGSNALVVKLGEDWDFPDIESELVYEDITNSIEEIEAGSKALIYPNPFENEINIEHDIDFEKAEIYSMDGRLIENQNINNKKLYLKHLPKGTYIINLTKDDRTLSQRIIKL